VVHHALFNVLKPILERSFVFDSYACRPDRRAHATVDCSTACVRKNRYVLKYGIRKFFPRVDHAMLLDQLARKIKDPEVMWLAGAVFGHSKPQEEVPGVFHWHDLFTVSKPRRGIQSATRRANSSAVSAWTRWLTP